MKKIRKIFMAMIMIAAMVITNIPYRTNAAGAATHTHDANCYIGTIHSAHGNGCYTSRQVEVPCGGVFRTYNTIYDYAPNAYYYIAYCGNPDCIRYGFRNGGDPTNQYIYKEMCFKSGSWTFYTDSHVTDPKCPYCGNKCYSGLYEHPNASSYRWQQYSWEYMDCSSCGAFNCRLNGNFSLIPGTVNYSTHRTKTVTENILTCMKELGSYYDSNGNKSNCICDRIVNTISAVAPEQILRPGEAINNKVTLGLYNGQTVADYSCEVSGFDPTDHSGNWQTVTLTTGTSDYPYRINGSGKREAGAGSVQIRVKILKPTYNVRTVDTEGGKIVFCPEGKETFEWITAAEGDKVVGKVLAKEGYFTEKLVIDGREVMLQTEDNGFEFIMPDHDVPVTVSFRRSECKVRFDPKGGNWAGYEDIYETTAHYGKT